MNKNLKNLLTKLTLGTITFGMCMSINAINANAIDLGELDPNCEHKNVYETFNEPYPCQLGDAEDTLYVYCGDCGGLIEEKIAVKPTNHGYNKYTDENGVERCELCNRPVNEKPFFKNVKIDEVQQCIEKIESLETDVYIPIDQKKMYFKNFVDLSNNGMEKIEGQYARKDYILSGKDEKINPAIDFSKLDENFICKNGHKHESLEILQNEGGSIGLVYQCHDCLYFEQIVYEADEIDTKEEREALAKENEQLADFWSELGLIDEPAKNLSFFDKIMNFFKNLFN